MGIGLLWISYNVLLLKSFLPYCSEDTIYITTRGEGTIFFNFLYFILPSYNFIYFIFIYLASFLMALTLLFLQANIM